MEEIQKMIHALGINATYQGHRFLCYAICLALEDEDRLLFISKSLYPLIAEKYNSNAGTIERNIRTVITVCWDRGNRDLLKEIAPYPLTSKPTAGEFIDILVTYFTHTGASQ